MWSELNNVVKDYSKVGKRNKNAIEHNKLGKHMMHLIRLYMMCLDILKKKKSLLIEKKNMIYLWIFVMVNFWIVTDSHFHSSLIW